MSVFVRHHDSCDDMRIPATEKTASIADVGFPIPPDRKTTRMRKALTKGLIVAAATTSALSLCGTWASAAPRMQGTALNSAGSLSSRSDLWDSEGLEEQLDDTFGEMNEKFGEMHERMQEVNDRLSGMGQSSSTSESVTTSSSTASAYGNSSDGYEKPSHGYGYEKPKDHGYEKPK
ncbi:MAG: hypothetical protein HOZ81_39810, partial [Streptomyces sp.]|nr:hypothetical protein [Streptomyces sp.]